MRPGPRRRAGIFLAESSRSGSGGSGSMKPRHQAPNTPRVPRRGPYSQVVRLGELLFVAGQAGLDPESGAIVPGFEAQARQAFENLRAVLEDAGSALQHVVKTTCFLADAD